MPPRMRPGYEGILGYERSVLDNNGGAGVFVAPGFDTLGLVIQATGVTITTGGTSAKAAIPSTSTGAQPGRIRLAATVACYAHLGLTGEESAAVSAIGSGYLIADTITLTGGTYVSPMVLAVASAQLASAAVNSPGTTGYVPADTITLAGGTFATAAVLTVATTKVVSATINAAGTGGTPGAATVTGTTGTGTKFQAAVTISAGGIITSVNSISVAGSYTVNPTDVTQEPVTGASLTGAKLAVHMGVGTFTVTSRGDYSATSTTFTQGSTSGSGAGATFNTGLFGVKTVTVSDPGDYTTDPSNPVAQGSSSGAGTAATFTVTWATAAVAGDILVQPGDSVILDATGADHVTAIQVSAAGILQISPLEN